MGSSLETCVAAVLDGCSGSLWVVPCLVMGSLVAHIKGIVLDMGLLFGSASMNGGNQFVLSYRGINRRVTCCGSPGVEPNVKGGSGKQGSIRHVKCQG